MCMYTGLTLGYPCGVSMVILPDWLLGRDDFNLTFMIFSGELPYDVGYPKKHIRPYGGGWGLLLYPAQQSPCWLNLEIGVFYFIFYFMSSDMFSIIVSYQNEHLQNIIVYCWHFPHPAPVLHWWLKINQKLPKKPKIKNHLKSCSKVIIAQNKCLFHHYCGMLEL